MESTGPLSQVAVIVAGHSTLLADLGRIRRTARPSLSLTGNLNCFPVSASGSISAQVIASGRYVLRLHGTAHVMRLVATSLRAEALKQAQLPCVMMDVLLHIDRLWGRSVQDEPKVWVS